jgi:hypothetical protein
MPEYSHRTLRVAASRTYHILHESSQADHSFAFVKLLQQYQELLHDLILASAPKARYYSNVLSARLGPECPWKIFSSFSSPSPLFRCRHACQFFPIPCQKRVHEEIASPMTENYTLYEEAYMYSLRIEISVSMLYLAFDLSLGLFVFEYPRLELFHELDGLFRKSQRKDSVWQDPGQMRKVSFVHGQDTLRLDRPVQAVKRRAIQVTRLVIHARHDCVRRVHDAANDEPTRCATRNMERHPLFHANVLNQLSLCEKVRRKLHRATKARSYHCWANASV